MMIINKFRKIKRLNEHPCFGRTDLWSLLKKSRVPQYFLSLPTVWTTPWSIRAYILQLSDHLQVDVSEMHQTHWGSVAQILPVSLHVYIAQSKPTIICSVFNSLSRPLLLVTSQPHFSPSGVRLWSNNNQCWVWNQTDVRLYYCWRHQLWQPL